MRLLLLPFFVAAVFGIGQDATDIFFGRVNYGVVKEPVTDETSFLFKGPLDGHDALADCSSDFTMLNLYSRGPKFVVEINCNGETKWAHYESTAVTQEDDLDEAPILDANLPGAFTPAAFWEAKMYPWFEPLKEDGCIIDYTRCGFRMLQVMQLTCPMVCGDNETHPLYSMSLDPSNSILNSIDDEVSMPGVAKMCTMKMENMLTEAGVNTGIILADAGLTSPIVDLRVYDGVYLELLTGTQYCMKVVDEDVDKTAVVSLYQFNLEDTKPIMVSLPFDEMATCEYFLKKVSCQWAAVDQCVYNL